MTIGGLDPPVGAGLPALPDTVPDRSAGRDEDSTQAARTRSARRQNRQSPIQQPMQRIGRSAAAFLTGGGRRRGGADALEPLVRVHRVHHPKADLTALQRAYEVAELSHRGQMRKSGEAYITHPLAVATLLAELGADTTTLVAALLHDTVEDTDLTVDQVRDAFGEDVAYLVDGVTKLEKVDLGDRKRAEAETLRKILVATGRDLRVTVIKLADRLHNMRTIRHMRRPSQIRIAEVTRDVFIPLAERLGIHVLKTELEDIVFATLRPEDHAATAVAVARAESHRDETLGTMSEEMTRVLREAGIEAVVTPRPRHHVSVRRVQDRRGRDDLSPYELARVMVVVDSAHDTDCYGALGVLHSRWQPVAGDFKDYIATPKFNLYQSLHTGLMTPEGDVVEVLIRTGRMHRLAEYGVVAHTTDDDAADAQDRLAWLRRLIAWQKGIPDAHVFWSSLTADLSTDREVLVFTEGGRPLTLPAGSTCVDAAYAIGEQTGHRCIGAQVGGRLVALSSVLRDGETVSIITAPPGAAGPSEEWLTFVRSPLARVAIERWLQAHPPQQGEAPGQAPDPASGPDPAASAPEQSVAVLPGGRRVSAPDTEGTAVSVPDVPDAPVRLARCCTPVPPDDLAGFVIRGGTVAVHRTDCPNVTQMRGAGRDVLGAVWLPHQADSGFRVTVELQAFDRPRLLADVTAAIAAADADITSASIAPPQQMRVRQTYTIRMADLAALPRLLKALRRVQGVYDVYRARPKPAPRV